MLLVEAKQLIKALKSQKEMLDLLRQSSNLDGEGKDKQEQRIEITQVL